MRTPRTLALLALAFAGRIAYGLSSPFWYEDERQVYLIGLRSFARGEWPYFGTEVAVDVVGAGQQLPGALQGWLIRLPLAVWPAPEAPFILLNALSFAALALLAWYCRRRLPALRAWLVWGALLTLPWTLNFSTHVVNTSYILPAGIIFFVGFLEGAPTFRAGVLPLWLAWTMMGAGLLAVVQVHLSWVLLPPYVLFAGIDLLRRNPAPVLRAAVAFAAGAASTGSLLLPTLVREGWSSGDGGSVVGFHPAHAAEIVTILARFLSFASFETNRFLGLTTADRLMFLWRQPWVVPFVLFVTLLGFVQPILMIAGWFRRRGESGEWQPVRWLAASTVLWIGVAFTFSARRPYAHAFSVVFPVAFVYAAYWWARSATPRWDRVAAAALGAGIVMHAGLAIDRAPRLSLYVDRPLVLAAISTPNDRFLGDRRGSVDSVDVAQDRRPRPTDPVPDPAAWLAATPADDLVVSGVEWSPLLAGRISRFTVSIRNASATAAYLDLRYATRYLNREGEAVAGRDGVIKEILQPGEVRTWRDLTDGSVPEDAARVEWTIVGAETVIPAVSVLDRWSS